MHIDVVMHVLVRTIKMKRINKFLRNNGGSKKIKDRYVIHSRMCATLNRLIETETAHIVAATQLGRSPFVRL